MIAVGHTAVGFGIGLLTVSIMQDPVLGLITASFGGLASHYLTDLIPHGHITAGKDNPYRSKLVYLDLFGGSLLFAVMAYFASGFSWPFLVILAGMGGGLLPDFLGYFFQKYKILNHELFFIERSMHDKTHWHGSGKNALPLGKRDIWQLAVVILSILLAFF